MASEYVELDILELYIQLLYKEGCIQELTNSEIKALIEERFGVVTTLEDINLLYEGEILNPIIIT